MNIRKFPSLVGYYCSYLMPKQVLAALAIECINSAVFALHTVMVTYHQKQVMAAAVLFLDYILSASVRPMYHAHTMNDVVINLANLGRVTFSR